MRKLIKFTFCKKVKVIHKTMRLIKADKEGEGTTIAKKVTKARISDMYLIYSCCTKEEVDSIGIVNSHIVQFFANGSDLIHIVFTRVKIINNIVLES